VRVEIEHLLPAPPERVFALLSDPARRPEWQENTGDVELLTPPPTGLGSRWRETQRGVGRVEMEVVGFTPGALWEEAGRAESGGGRITIALRPEGDGATRARVTVELTLRGARRLMGAALAPMVRRQVPADLERLAALLAAD
jgi:uncharacterized protein YndB with AHSA1/START domain